MELVGQPVYIDHWSIAPALSTYGKREKDVRIDPSTGKMYFYKHSDRRYPWDFWCEVIASKLGQLLGLDIAHYEPAYAKDGSGGYVWGCFSPLLHDPTKGEEFVHGQSYLQFMKPDFDTDRGTDHDYELIRKALLIAGALDGGIEKFHEMLVFDALICNRDRHQENWAIIRSAGNHPSPTNPARKAPKQGTDTNWWKQIAEEIVRMLSARLAPIYDSGTSLGHNLLDSKMERMLAEKDKTAFARFTSGPKATAHIRVRGKRVRHDELLRIIGITHPKLVKTAMNKVLDTFDQNKVAHMLKIVDNAVMTEAAKMKREVGQDLIPSAYVLSPVRKAFISELLYLRHQELCKLREQIRA